MVAAAKVGKWAKLIKIYVLVCDAKGKFRATGLARESTAFDPSTGSVLMLVLV